MKPLVVILLLIIFVGVSIQATKSYSAPQIYLSSFVPKASAINLVGPTYQVVNIDSLTLPYAGTWTVSGIYMDSVLASISPKRLNHGFSTVSATVQHDTCMVKSSYDNGIFASYDNIQAHNLPSVRFTISSPTKIYYIVEGDPDPMASMDCYVWGQITATKVK